MAMVQNYKIKTLFYTDVLYFTVLLLLGIIHWSPRIQGILSRGKLAVQQTQESTHNYLISLLLKGKCNYYYCIQLNIVITM